MSRSFRRIGWIVVLIATATPTATRAGGFPEDDRSSVPACTIDLEPGADVAGERSLPERDVIHVANAGPPAHAVRPPETPSAAESHPPVSPTPVSPLRDPASPPLHVLYTQEAPRSALLHVRQALFALGEARTRLLESRDRFGFAHVDYDELDRELEAMQRDLERTFWPARVDGPRIDHGRRVRISAGTLGRAEHHLNAP